MAATQAQAPAKAQHPDENRDYARLPALRVPMPGNGTACLGPAPPGLGEDRCGLAAPGVSLLLQ